MLKAVLLLITLSVPASSGPSGTQQESIPSFLVKQIVEEKIRDEKIKFLKDAANSVYHLCSTQGFITLYIKQERVRINCTPDKQV